MLSGRMVPSSVSCFAVLTWGERGPAHLGRRPEAAGLQEAVPRAAMVPGRACSWVTVPHNCLQPGAARPARCRPEEKLHPADLRPVSPLNVTFLPQSPYSPRRNILPSASPAVPQHPAHRLLHFFWVSFGVLVSFLGRNHEALLLPLYVPEDDWAAVVVFVVENAAFVLKLGACFQPMFIKLLGWELTDVFVLAGKKKKKKGEGEMNKLKQRTTKKFSTSSIILGRFHL